MNSTIVAAIIGAIATVISGILGYNKKIIQKQKAKENSTQVQIAKIVNNYGLTTKNCYI